MAFGKGFEARRGGAGEQGRLLLGALSRCPPARLACFIHTLLPTLPPACAQAAGQAGAALDSIRWGSDYLLKVDWRRADGKHCG